MLSWVQSQWNHPKLERHLETKHSKKNVDSSNGMNGAAIIEASYESTFEITKQKKLH